MDKILVLSGDGIGPAVISSAEEVLKAACGSLEIIHGQIGRSAYEDTGSYLPHDTLDLLDESKVILSGPVYVPENGKDPLQLLKVQLDLFSRGRYYKTLAGDLGVTDMEVTLWSSYNNIASEITEVKDFDGVTISKYIRSNAYSRMMSSAMTDIEMRGLKKICCLSRGDFFPISSGMFIEAFDTLFETAGYETRSMNVKDWMSTIFKDPLHDDCIICVDLYNQLVAGALSGLCGNENLFPTVYSGSDYALYEPNFTPEIEGSEPNYENPTSAIYAASVILSHMGMNSESKRIIDALCSCYEAGERTPDVDGSLTCQEFTEKVIDRI